LLPIALSNIAFPLSNIPSNKTTSADTWLIVDNPKIKIVIKNILSFFISSPPFDYPLFFRTKKGSPILFGEPIDLQDAQ
jgi:hypothetical protein